MKNQQIKLTPKQSRIMESLNIIFDIHELKPVYMGEIKETIVIEQKIVNSAWYHRTMDALEKLSLIQIVDSNIEVKQGPYKGKLIPVKAYELTELGKQYLGINKNIMETPVKSNISVDFDNQISRLADKSKKDLIIASKYIAELNQICKAYNVELKIVPRDRGIFANDEQHYKVVNTVREHLSIEDLRVFGEKAQHILEDINGILYQVSVTENKIYELNQLNARLCNTTIDLINELQLKNYNSIELITWHMVKRNIVSTLEQAQEVIGYLYKSGAIQETKRVYTSSTIKIFVEIVPITSIDEECEC